MSDRRVASFLLLGFFAMPYILLAIQIRQWSLPVEEASGVLAFTTLQALLSSAASLIVGAVGAMGLTWAGARVSTGVYRALEFCVLLPNAAPVLVLLLAMMRFLPELRGLPGLVFVHVCLNAGLVAITIANLFRTKIGGMAELAFIEGASRWRFLTHGAFKYLRADLVTLAVFVFAVSFASFAAPLMIGGASATTMETLIYQKVRTFGRWDQAVALALVQMLAIFAFAWTLRTRRHPELTADRPIGVGPLLQAPVGLSLLLIPPCLMLAGLLPGLSSGAWGILYWRDLSALLGGSVAVSISVGVLTSVLLFAISFIQPTGRTRQIFRGYVAPSTVLTGFALLFIWRTTGLASYVKIAIGLSLVMVPTFYRMQLDGILTSLKGQLIVAQTMGASHGLVHRKIVLPQIARSVLKLGGLAAVWAWGDFSLSVVVAERSLTLAMHAQSLMAAYRFDAAAIVIVFVVLGAGLTFALFDGVGRVLGSPSQA